MVRALLCVCAALLAPVTFASVAVLSAAPRALVGRDFTDETRSSSSSSFSEREQEEQRSFLLLLRNAAKRDRPAERGGPGPPPVSRGSRTEPAAVSSASNQHQPMQQQADGTKSNLIIRQPRGKRQYDVPQIECPPTEDGMERFACPSPDAIGRYRCIDDHVLCDGFIDCPNEEDEDRKLCMFYKTTKAHLDLLADALLRWARGR